MLFRRGLAKESVRAQERVLGGRLADREPAAIRVTSLVVGLCLLGLAVWELWGGH